MHCPTVQFNHIDFSGEYVITSKQLIDSTGISRATLNNYINLGLLPKPLVMNPGKDGGGARQLGYFPDNAVERINSIQRLKREGVFMTDIVLQLKDTYDGATTGQREPESASVSYLSGRAGDGGTLNLSIEQIPHPAYMVNYNLEVMWYNQAARDDILGGFDGLPSNSDGRSVLRLICKSPEMAARNTELLRFHMELAKGRLSQSAFTRVCQQLPAESSSLLEAMYSAAKPMAKRAVLDAPLQVSGAEGSTQNYQAYASFYREGILIVYAPADGDARSLLGILARRDDVIRELLSKRLPVLTPLAVIVAALQNSVKICSELSAEEYFELINEIWAAMGPIFRKYYGTHGKHVGDGMVYYFFPQPDSNYIVNALLCAQKIKQEMQKISKSWQIRKNWLHELFLNTGVNEGEEWLGTFQSATCIEFAILGNTINHAGRLSEFARHGEVWATKSLIGKLSVPERARANYGIKRHAADGRDVFVGASFSLISELVDLNEGRFEKFREVAALPVTEIIDITPAP